MEVKVLLLVNDRIVYISNHKNSTIELLQLMNTFNKMSGNKIKSNKSVALLYTNDQQAETEIRETRSFIIAMDNIKYLGVTNQASERSV